MTTKRVVNIRRNWNGHWQWKDAADSQWNEVTVKPKMTQEEMGSHFLSCHVFKLEDIPHPTAYTCRINEYQRDLLVKLMTAVKLRPDMVATLANMPGDINGNAYIELCELDAMLVNLPEIEAGHPGVTHGLCL